MDGILQDFRRRANELDWDWDNADARAFTHEVLGLVAKRFDGAIIKERPDDENIDLRASYDGAPVRFAVWMSFGSFWSIEMKIMSTGGMFDMSRDHEKIPKNKDDDDPWDDDEESRIFVGKGIFVEGGDREIEGKLGVWSMFPEELQARILSDMELLDLSDLRLYNNKVMLNSNVGLKGIDDPAAYMEACAKLMAALKAMAATTQNLFAVKAVIPNARSHALGAAPWRQVTCQFCSSLFFLTLEKNRCPNCGAPATS